jgi:flagellin
MALVINTNLGSINGQRNLSNSNAALTTAMQRLSSGARINGAKDDAAGLAIADRMTSQVRGMTIAVRNAYDGISLTQTAEGSLGSLTDTLQRMRDLAVQSSSNAGVSVTDREKMQTEFKALNNELIRVVEYSEFNGKKILNGDLASGLAIQVGANTDKSSQITVTVSNMTTLLKPVTNSSLNPKNESADATFFAATVNNASIEIVANADLKAANNASKLASAAVKAATLASASPTDLALAKAASDANAIAAAAISASSTNILAKTNENKASNLVADAFVAAVTTANSANVAAANSIGAANTDGAITAAAGTTNFNIQNASSTDLTQASSLLTTANQLAAAASADVDFMAKNVYESTMNAITGDSIAVPDSSVTGAKSTLNDAVSIAEKGSFKADRVAQKAMAALDIAKAVAGASYVNDPTQTVTANDVNKTSFVKNNKLVQETSMKSDGVAMDYALQAINKIDDAIATIDTERSNLGSTQNRFTTTISNLQNGIENQSAAKSRISDADFAQETAALSRAQILQQAGTAMLAQANQSGQSVMTLLR